MPAYHVSFYNRFFDSLGEVDERSRPRVFDALAALRSGTSSTPVVRHASTDFYRFDLPAAGLRVVCHLHGTTLVMLFVGPVAAADVWAQGHRTVTAGSVLRVVARGDEADDPARVSQAPWGEARRPVLGPLARYRKRQLARFGIGPSAADALRRLKDDDEVVELAELMVRPVADLLIGLATDEDLDVLQRVYDAARARPDEARGPTPQADVRDHAANTAHVYTPSTIEELQAAITGPPDDWQVFLHPQQRRAIEARTRGAVKVTGGPGTGKTVVAVHRARFLARDVFAHVDQPVLLTVFTRTLTGSLRQMVDHLCAGSHAVAERIEVLDLVGVAQRVLAQARRPHAVADDDLVDRSWAHAMSTARLDWSRTQYEAERTHVLGRNGAWTKEDYLLTPRPGRSVPLGRGQREAAWETLHAFEEALADAGAGDPLALLRHAEGVLRDGVVPSPFVAAVCDEVQDASAAGLRLLAALTHDPETRETRTDGLFLCGDGYQRVYARPIPLNQCGIEVRGRSWTLRVNYRTTEGIRQAAMQQVADLEPDILDAGDDDSLDGYRSERGGPPPQRHRFATEEAEIGWVAEQGREGPLLVVTRQPVYRDRLVAGLRRHGLTVTLLDDDGVPGHGVTVCTLHRAKGLEAPRVVVAGVQQLPAPFVGDDDGDRAWWSRSEQCLLYVGMTRARDWLAITEVSA